ncbi:hypothetical protein Aph02nite_32800 [Actinoplanes philippinensis]|nr:hypothetical protein Aph02nite_32800 [Actinoplanes philippinensis]
MRARTDRIAITIAPPMAPTTMRQQRILPTAKPMLYDTLLSELAAETTDCTITPRTLHGSIVVDLPRFLCRLPRAW